MRLPVPAGFNYGTNGGRITTSSTPRPKPFTWGQVTRVHVVGDDYAIVEFLPNRVGLGRHDRRTQFSVFVRGARGTGWDTGHSYYSLDKALIAAIAWRAEQRHHGQGAAANSKAVRYIARLLELPDD